MPNSLHDAEPLAASGEHNGYYNSHLAGNHTYHDDPAHETNDMYEHYYEKHTTPTKRPFYKNKKYWILCSIISVILIVVVIVLILFVAFPKIAQHTIDQSQIDVTKAQITFDPPSGSDLQAGNDPNSTFFMHMATELKNTGPFSADIQFTDKVQILFNGSELGTVTLPDTHVSGGHGYIDTVTLFNITDAAAFSGFTKYMMATEKFKWTLNGKAKVSALSRTADVNMIKEIELEGMNGFPQVRINSFNAPGDVNGGGIAIELGTVLTSPSPIGVQLGHIEMAMSYEGLDLGIVQADNVAIQKGDNNIVLKGFLKSQKDSLDGQVKVSKLFSNYLGSIPSNTTATGVSAAPNGKDPINWLSDGLKSVVLHVSLAPEQPIKIINYVSMGYLDLAFKADAPYSPSISAPSVTAGFSMPFGFGLNITEVTQNLTLGLNNSGKFDSFALLNVPFVPSTSDQASGKLQFTIPQASIAGIPDKQNIFNEYTYGLTSSGNYSFVVNGSATTKVQTSIGPLVLSGINFEVPTNLHGLEFLNSSATVIHSIDVTGGQSDHLLLSINVTMENPSDFSIATGDVKFNMLSESTQLGQVFLRDLKLARGSNNLVAQAEFDPKSSDTGKKLLSSFVMGQENNVEIQGTEDSTPIVSLAGGLKSVSLSSVLPGLSTALIQGSSLSVPDSAVNDGLVNVKVSIANPFSAGMIINKVAAAATFAGMPVGNIDQDISSNPIIIPGKSTVQSGDLAMRMNVEAGAVALLMRSLAVNANLNTRPLDALLTIGGFNIDGQENVEADPSLFENFNLSNFVMDAMKALKVDLNLASGLSIGQYDDTLSFSQSSVQIASDYSITSLIPIVGQKIVQQIVDAAVLSFDSIVMSAPTESGFKVQMKGSIKKTGPMPATISFPTPLTVSWQGKALGKVTMPSINALPFLGASIDVLGDFTITDAAGMTAFATYMLNNEAFVWDITTQDVAVSALGFTFKGIKMEKFVRIYGANGFKNAVKVNKFDLPRNTPDNNGIVITVDSTISNPSQVGFNLNGVTFESIYKDVTLGPLSSAGAAVFPPRGQSNMAMEGQINKQTSEQGIAAINEVFANYLNAKSSVLTVKGASASGPNGPVSWLTAAFKTLKIENVVLPGPPTKPNLISSVNMNDLQMDFTKDPFAPPAGSHNVQSQIKSPFGFPLGITSLNMKVNANAQGHNVASLDVPNVPASTSADGVVTFGFNDIPFKVYSGAEQVFAAFVGGLTLLPKVPFGLAGIVNSVAHTAVGDITLNNVAFDVQTSMNGFAGFGGATEIVSLKVVGGYPTYIAIDLVVAMNNPSNITITTPDLTFDVVMDATSSSIGSVTLPKPVIVPGRNEMKANMKMGGTDLMALSRALTGYLTGQVTAVTVKGTPTSSNVPPLAAGLSKLQLKTNLVGIPPNLVVETQMELVDLSTVKIWVKFNNPLDTQFTVVGIDCIAYFTDGEGKYRPLGALKGNMEPPVTVPARSVVLSENPILMSLTDTDTGIAFIMLQPDQQLVDLVQNVTVVVGESFHGAMHYEQKQVPVLQHQAPATLSIISSSLNSSIPVSSVMPSVSSSIIPSVITTTVVSEVSTTPVETATPATTTVVTPTATATTTNPTTTITTEEPKTTTTANPTTEAPKTTATPNVTTEKPTEASSGSSTTPVIANNINWPF
ncbi:hypothetical protein BY458DRAFT_552105 [Sporodiniella umbellata]|nr:hypothetical protein BY458DRAFT_552105 [Sporodiniella umbellata]